MNTATITYEGAYNCSCLHNQSGTTIYTDAPTDNKGKGENFSPTDLVCVALATCMLTTMAIKTSEKTIPLTGTTVAVKKIMQPEPRKIERIELEFTFPPHHNYSFEQQQKLIEIAETCPVALSLNPDIAVQTKYNW